MNQYHLDIQKGESEQVEFKKSTSTMRELIETLCAFANHRGGAVFIGIDDSGNVINMPAITDDTLKNIANAVQLNTDPKLYPEIEAIELKGKTCIRVSIEESPLKPHLAYGRAFNRVGTTNRKLDRDSYEYLLQQRSNGYGFDFLVQKKASMDDIDTEQLYQFIEKANAVRNLNENLFLPPELLLDKLGLVKNGKVSNAALLLFGKNPANFFEGNFEMKCGLFSVDEGYDNIINHKEYKSNLLQNFDLAYGFLLSSINSSLVKNGKQSVEKYELPLPALREVLVNMIVHKNYRIGIKNTIEIRPGYIQFQNPGTLFEPTISIEKLKKPHPSRPGNKLIAKIFYMMGLFENWGSGTLKVYKELEKEGKRAPEFSYDDGIFGVKILRNKE